MQVWINIWELLGNVIQDTNKIILKEAESVCLLKANKTVLLTSNNFICRKLKLESVHYSLQ